jgi:2-iminoacetate synthase ThiH
MDEKPAAAPTLEPEDYYMKGSIMVFTAAYHLKRGTCCNSGCRHCPFREPEKVETPQTRNSR